MIHILSHFARAKTLFTRGYNDLALPWIKRCRESSLHHDTTRHRIVSYCGVCMCFELFAIARSEYEHEHKKKTNKLKLIFDSYFVLCAFSPCSLRESKRKTKQRMLFIGLFSVMIVLELASVDANVAAVPTLFPI